MKVKTSTPRYVLGTSTHLFTNDPEFISPSQALAYAEKHYPGQPVYIHQEMNVSKFGIVFGIVRQVVMTKKV